MLIYNQRAVISEDDQEFIDHLKYCRFNLPAMEQAIDQIGTIELNQETIEDILYNRVCVSSSFQDSSHLFLMIKWDKEQQREFVEKQITKHNKNLKKFSHLFLQKKTLSAEQWFDLIKSTNKAMKMLNFWECFVLGKL